jgi:hypothetical protein
MGATKLTLVMTGIACLLIRIFHPLDATMPVATWYICIALESQGHPVF